MSEFLKGTAYEQSLGISLDPDSMMDKLYTDAAIKNKLPYFNSPFKHSTLIALSARLSVSLEGFAGLREELDKLNKRFDKDRDKEKFEAGLEALKEKIRTEIGDTEELDKIKKGNEILDDIDKLKDISIDLDTQKMGSGLSAISKGVTGLSKGLEVFGIWMDFRTQPFAMDFSTAYKGFSSIADTLGVVIGVLDFIIDTFEMFVEMFKKISQAMSSLATKLAESVTLKTLGKIFAFFDVAYSVFGFYRNLDSALNASSLKEGILYGIMAVLDVASVILGVVTLVMLLSGSIGVVAGIVLAVIGIAIAVIQMIIGSIVALVSLEGYSDWKKIGLFFDSIFGGHRLDVILTVKALKDNADKLWEGEEDEETGEVTKGLKEDFDAMIIPLPTSNDGNLDKGQLGFRVKDGAPGVSLDASAGFTASTLNNNPDTHREGNWYFRKQSSKKGRVLFFVPKSIDASSIIDMGSYSTVFLIRALPLAIFAKPADDGAGRLDWWRESTVVKRNYDSNANIKLNAEVDYTIVVKENSEDHTDRLFYDPINSPISCNRGDDGIYHRDNPIYYPNNCSRPTDENGNILNYGIIKTFKTSSTFIINEPKRYLDYQITLDLSALETSKYLDMSVGRSVLSLSEEGKTYTNTDSSIRFSADGVEQDLPMADYVKMVLLPEEGELKTGARAVVVIAKDKCKIHINNVQGMSTIVFNEDEEIDEDGNKKTTVDCDIILNENSFNFALVL